MTTHDNKSSLAGHPVRKGPLSNRGMMLCISGWAVFALSILFAMSSKSANVNDAVPFWFVIGILVLVSLIYFIGCLVSPAWRSKPIRRYFTPYVLGSFGWLTLWLVFWLVDRFGG